MSSRTTYRVVCFATLMIALSLILAAPINAQTRTTIHILHPWANDPLRSSNPPYVRTSETGWYPGIPMSAEGGNWYTYTFSRLNRNTNDRLEIVSYIPDQYNDYTQALIFSAGQQLIFMTIFQNAAADANEVWIVPSRTGGAAQLLFTPPAGGKTINFLNPWEIGAPQTHIKGLGSCTMKMDRRSDRCGWFSYHYYGVVDSCQVLFENSLDRTFFGKRGSTDTSYINLAPIFAKSDSVWVYMPPAADTAVTVSSKFPNVAGECAKTINLAATMRDIGLHPDFGTYPDLEADKCGGLQPGMVEKKLGPDGKPVKKAHRCTGLHSQFDWFDTKVLSGTLTNETCYNLTLTQNEEGIYEYDTNYFFPLDSFIYLDDARTIRNPNNNLFIESTSKPPANVHFTMELTAQFEYVKGQTFYFRGDDDVWVFIDSELVVDLGGNHGPEEGSVELDNLGLTPGITYNFKLFFVERNCCGSNFLMQTSINLRTSSRMLSITTTPAPGKIQVDLFERISRSSVSCNPSESDIDTINASALFFIQGPQFAEWTKLPGGLSYGGIYISNDNSIVTIDTTSITGFESGLYTISYQLRSDPSQKGQISFSVVKPAKPPLVQNPVTAAACFADNGFGQVQRVEIYYTNNLAKVPDSVILYWPEPIEECRRAATGPDEIFADPADPKHITVKPPLPFDSLKTKHLGTSQLGSSYIFDPTFLQPYDVSRFEIADSVGPLLLGALMPERRDTGDDSMFLTFTELPMDGSIIGQSLLLIKSDGTQHSLTVSSVSPRLDTIIVRISKTTASPAAGDSLRIASQGPLTDRFANHAHSLNRPVPIIIRKAAGKVVVACYRDRNADGIVDEATFNFDRPVAIGECTFSMSWVNGCKASGVAASSLHYGGDSTVVIADLSTAFTPVPPLATSGLMSFQLSISGPAQSEQSGFCTDNAAPVLILAQYRPAAFGNEQTAFLPDTLIVTFSEPVPAIASISPVFLQKPGTAAATSPALSQVNRQETIVTLLVPNPPSGDLYPSDNDSAYINPTALITDFYGNAQTNPANRRVLLDVAELVPHFRISIGPNPFDPALEPLRILIDPYVKTKGSVSFTVELRIYDKVGSIVRELPWPAGKQPASAAETIFWNGTNRHGRIVGNGTYIAYVKVFDGSGSLKTTDTRQPLKIGVLRGKNLSSP